MKLQTKTNYRFLVLLLIVFFLAGAILYFVLGLVVNDNLDEILEHRSEIVKQNLEKSKNINFEKESQDETIEIIPTTRINIHTEFSDTSIFDKSEREYVNNRKIKFGVISYGKNYVATIVISKLETEDLVELIFYFMLGLFAFIALLLFFLNRWTSTSLWNPFYKTLNRLDAFKIGNNNVVDFGKTDIYEFEQLNKALTRMVQKAQADFHNLKEFTENASHEIQTPLAIIKSKLETILQNKTLQNESYLQIQSAYESVSRLSKLNQALLLLSKIENQQFTDDTNVNLCELVKERLEFIKELIEFKKIEIILNLKEPIIVKMNPQLAEILVNNLLGNAVKHNLEAGKIVINSTEKKLIISNTGLPLTVAPEKLFQRFTKQNAGNESSGLGLAIVSEICKSYQLSIQYNYGNGIHNISLSSN